MVPYFRIYPLEIIRLIVLLVMLRVTVEVQGMQLQAVADTAAQFTLVSEEFNKSLDHFDLSHRTTGIRMVPYFRIYPLEIIRLIVLLYVQYGR
jgi:hypothetical protein